MEPPFSRLSATHTSCQNWAFSATMSTKPARWASAMIRSPDWGKGKGKGSRGGRGRSTVHKCVLPAQQAAVALLHQAVQRSRYCDHKFTDAWPRIRPPPPSLSLSLRTPYPHAHTHLLVQCNRFLQQHVLACSKAREGRALVQVVGSEDEGSVKGARGPSQRLVQGAELAAGRVPARLSLQPVPNPAPSLGAGVTQAGDQGGQPAPGATASGGGGTTRPGSSQQRVDVVARDAPAALHKRAYTPIKL